jgi:prepilin-type N-terminal cleavage/methylation domain-containing protein
MSRDRRGFTIVETLVAVIILSIGVLALASTVGGITRMMSSGQQKTRAGTVAVSILDSLRTKAYSSIPKCSGLINGSQTTGLYGSRYASSWTISGAGTSRDVRIEVSYRVGPRVQGDTLLSTIHPPCP